MDAEEEEKQAELDKQKRKDDDATEKEADMQGHTCTRH
jgi:hypothetical protein